MRKQVAGAGLEVDLVLSGSCQIPQLPLPHLSTELHSLPQLLTLDIILRIEALPGTTGPGFSIQLWTSTSSASFGPFSSYL